MAQLTWIFSNTNQGGATLPLKPKRIMKKVYNIYDISTGQGVYVQTVTKEISARLICKKHNQNGERNYMYLLSYE